LSPVARIAIVNVPFYSHVRAATRLSAALGRQGHTVASWGPIWAQQWIEHSGASYRRHEPPMPGVTGHTAFVASLAQTTEEIVGTLIEELFEFDPHVVVHDSQVPWARVAAEFLGLPRIVSHPMFPIVSPRHVGGGTRPGVPQPDPEAARAAFERSWLAIARRWGVELGNWDGIIHDTSEKEATIAFTTERIVDEKRLKPGWHCVGPLMEPRARSAEVGARPLVYACFGTSFNRRAAQYRAVIDGLAEEPVDVLVSTGAGEVKPESLGPLPDNVTAKEFVDGRATLARARIHITHGGCNSVHESLLAGVPMLCVPQGYDQFPLTHRIQELGAGAIVSEEADEIRAGVRWLLDDETPHARADELRRHLEEYDGEARVAELFERVLDENAATVA
jgi:MGT family glycosyltransferase